MRPLPLPLPLPSHLRRGAIALAALALCLSPQAQTLPEVKVTDTTNTTEGSYTARTLDTGKTGAALRETPQSVSVITRQQLDDRNLTKVEDAVRTATGVSVTRFDGAGNYNTIQTRGFDIGAILLDGMPISLGSNYSTALDTAVYDRIEILRGPAGLLQGAGEPGGTINLVRKRAMVPLAIGANVQLGSFGLRRADVDLTGALNASGTLRGRVVAVTEDRDSFVDVLFNKKELGYGTLELDINPATTLSVGLARQRARSVVDQGLPTYANGQLIDAPRSTFAGVSANRQDMDTDDAFAELEHRLANGGLVKAAVREVKRTNFYRSARANSAAAANGDYRMETVDLGGELRDRSYDLYLSTPFTLGGRQHKVLAGYNPNDRDTGDGNFAYGPTYAANVFRPNYNMAYPNIVLPGFTGVTTRTEDAIYGQAQFSVAERLKLIAGGRLSWAEVQSRRTRDGVITSQTKPGRQFTPQVSALYDINANLTAYASYVETFVVQTQLDAARNLLPPAHGQAGGVRRQGRIPEQAAADAGGGVPHRRREPRHCRPGGHGRLHPRRRGAKPGPGAGDQRPDGARLGPAGRLCLHRHEIHQGPGGPAGPGVLGPHAAPPAEPVHALCVSQRRASRRERGRRRVMAQRVLCAKRRHPHRLGQLRAGQRADRLADQRSAQPEPGRGQPV